MKEMYQTMAQMNLGLASLLKKMVGGETTEVIRNAREKGAGVKAIIPEYDVVYTLQEFQYLLKKNEEEALQLVAYVTGVTHASSGMNATGVAQAVKHLVG